MQAQADTAEWFRSGGAKRDIHAEGGGKSCGCHARKECSAGYLRHDIPSNSPKLHS
jgi:hypothetical protein